MNPQLAKSGGALEKATVYITWLIPVLESFPRSQRFLLGDRLQTLAMDTVALIVEATYQKLPQSTLLRVNLLLEQQRVFIRLAYNLKHIDVRRYEFAARKIDELGQSIGAWIKACKSPASPQAGYQR